MLPAGAELVDQAAVVAPSTALVRYVGEQAGPPAIEALDDRCTPGGCICYSCPTIHLGLPVRVAGAALRHAADWWPEPPPGTVTYPELWTVPIPALTEVPS
jgi:hypothetical protein